MRIDAELVNVLTGQRVAGPNVTTAAANLRNAAHRIADALFEKIIGVRGAFATRIAYVSVDGKPPTQRYELYVADADGANRSANPGIAAAHHVAGLVDGWRMAGLRVVRAARVRRLRAAPAQRQEVHGVGTRRHQWRAHVLAR